MRMKNQGFRYLLLAFMLVLAVAACKKDPVPDKPEPEPDDGSTTGTIDTVTVFSNINADPNVADYIIKGALNVESELRIDSGVVIEMLPGASIVVKTTGTLIARGDANNPIIFTGQTKSRGSWKFIMINSNDPRNELTYAQIEYGGGDDSNNGAIYLNSGAYLNLRNSHISNSKNNAVVVAADDATLADFNNNTIDNNGYVMQLRPNQLPQIHNTNTYTNNDNSYITLIGSYIRTPLIWGKKDVPFLHKGVTVIEADVTMTEGVNMQFDFASYIRVAPNGSFKATGTSGQRIVFNSVNPIQGYWYGLFIESRSNNNLLSYVDMAYAGGSPTHMGSVYVGTSISYPDAMLTMSNCNISQSAGWGIYVQANADFLNGGGNSFAGNIMGDIGP